MQQNQLTGTALKLTWTAQVVAAVILGQTLFFKFTGAPEAVELFTTLGVEPFGTNEDPLDADERARFPVVAGQTYYLRVVGETLMSLARRYWLMPMGNRNSSRRISPGWMGASFLAAMSTS